MIVGEGRVDIWGMTSSKRLRRSFARAGIADVRPLGGGLGDASGPLILIRADWVFDQRLIEALIRSPGTVLVSDPAGTPVAVHAGEAAGTALAAIEAGDRDMAAGLGWAMRTPAELGGRYDGKLRKRELPFLLPLTRETLPQIRDRTFQASYKGVTDVVTKHVWPRPAKAVTGWCAARGITPNQVTWTSFALVLLAFWLFWTGHFAAGLAAAWLMTFLDTVDGKLARVTLNYSKAGDILDHGIDLVHPPFWWWAWIVGLAAGGYALPDARLILAVVVIGYVAQRIEEGVFQWRFKIEMHVWRPFDSWFRGVTARRNPNLVLLTLATLAGRPDWGMVAVALWTAISFLIHLWQIVRAFLAERRAPITSWMSA